MELSTIGAILSFALGIEEEALSFYEMIQSSGEFQGWDEIIDMMCGEHRRATRNLARLRRESVTEMILEPIHDFRSDEYELNVTAISDIDEQGSLAMMKRIEANMSEFFKVAATKTMFLQEVSLALENIASRRQRNLKALEQLG